MEKTLLTYHYGRNAPPEKFKRCQAAKWVFRKALCGTPKRFYLFHWHTPALVLVAQPDMHRLFQFEVEAVLGQAYIWYDPNTKTVCYDNIEIPKKVLKELRSGQKHGSALSSNALIDAVERSAESIMDSMNKKGIKVERVTTGEGHNDLIAELSQRFVREQKPAAMHRGYEGYSDAIEAQYVIKTYDELTNMYAANILKTDCEISNTIDLLSCQDRSME